MNDFSVSRHATFFNGYLDAVSRTLTTDAELFCLSARLLERGDPLEFLADEVAVDNWSAEFGALLDDVLGLDQRSRLGFYLIDYIDWFQWYTVDAQCTRHGVGRTGADYSIFWPDGSRVVMSFHRVPKSV